MNWPSIGGVRLTTRRVILLAVVLLDAILTISGKLNGLSSLITSILVIWGVWRLFRLVLSRSQLIWKVRNRLIVTYVFISIVPITLILALFFVLGLFLTAQSLESLRWRS